MVFMKKYKRIFIACAFVVVAGAIYLHGQMSAPLGPYGNLGFPISIESGQTPTLVGNEMVGELSTTYAGAATATTASATDICLLFPFVGNSGAQGFAYDWYVKAGASTTDVVPTGGTGVTVVGTGTNANSTIRHWKIVLNACPIGGTTSPTAAVHMYSLETTAF